MITCQVNVNVFGHRTVVLTKSTGSKLLDDYIVAYAKEYYDGSGKGHFLLPIAAKVVEVSDHRVKSKVTVFTPRLGNLLQALAEDDHGRGTVKVSLGESGRAMNAGMAQSTGSKILDDHAVNYALAVWRSSGGEKVATTVPVIY